MLPNKKDFRSKQAKVSNGPLSLRGCLKVGSQYFFEIKKSVFSFTDLNAECM
jgi:hypothetical protein